MRITVVPRILKRAAERFPSVEVNLAGRSTVVSASAGEHMLTFG
jgi:hypothetical protein